ncbi:hypothetical protein PG997_007098 [Apiospora hydei]|uniref:F-box domain-containing protein n=1 Tax=Apiospora hydei TaxID=1337664 RepID=A0ABR1WQS1_9PEZI
MPASPRYKNIMKVIDQVPETQQAGQLVPSKRISHQPSSAFTNLPLDVIMTIQDHLPAETGAYLGLTCRAAMEIFKHQPLERDLSDRFYYCWDCARLHRYSKNWKLAFDQARVALPPCQQRPHSIGAWHFGFHHFQLVMNEYLYGKGRGLPTGILQSGQFGLWSAWPTMAVLDGQVFIKARYLLILSGTWYRFHHQLLEMDQQRLRFCAHLDSRRLPELRLVREHRPLERSDATGYCDTCLTDYRFKLDRCPFPRQGAWDILVTTYHQLGPCRRPDEWMWRCFVGGGGGDDNRSGGDGANCTTTRQQYLHGDHPPGAVIGRWDPARAEEQNSWIYSQRES